ncbi:MAG: NAD-dependent epimerase/dehydratase family protein [Candidatus Pacearchaeota archaeon]
MKKIIITGAGGLVGLSLLTKIDSLKYQITAIDKNKNNLRIAKKINPRIKTICVDVSKNGSWEREFKGCDVVIQLQAQISSPLRIDYIKNNIESVKNIIKICEKYKIKHLIHLSSSVVMSVARDDYSETKTSGEKLVKDSKLKYTIFRPPLMYGEFDIKHLGFLANILDKSPVFPVPGSGKYIRQPLFVYDLVEIILNCLEAPAKNQSFNIISKEKIYFIELIKEIARQRGQKRVFINIPLPIFSVLLKTYSLLFRKNPYEKSQLYALIAGDVFPVENWEKEFNVIYTPFKLGVCKMIKSKYYPLRKLMIK